MRYLDSKIDFISASSSIPRQVASGNIRLVLRTIHQCELDWCILFLKPSNKIEQKIITSVIKKINLANNYIYMIQNSTLNFLESLAQNNDREWFNAHKSDYLNSLKDIESTASTLLSNIKKYDPRLEGVDVKKCIFRIYRDVRFSKNKEPYKTHIGIFFAPGGKNSFAPGYYLHIEPNASFIGGGVWMPPTSELFALRQEIYYNFEDFKTITNEETFKKQFPDLDHTFKHIKTPKGFDADFEGIEIIKHKCFFFAHPLSNQDLTSTNLDTQLEMLVQLLAPLNHFFQRSTEK